MKSGGHTQTDRQLRLKVGPKFDSSQLNALRTKVDGRIDFATSGGITGETAAWIVISTLTAQALPHVLKFIQFLISNGDLKEFSYGKLKIKNPTPEITQQLENKFSDLIKREEKRQGRTKK